MSIEFQRLEIKHPYIDPDKERLLAQAMHLFNVGFDIANDDTLPEYNHAGAVLTLIRDFIDQDPKRHIHVAKEEGTVVAVASYDTYDRLIGHARIDGIVVEPKFRAKGIGRRMLAHLAGQAEIDGLRAIRLRARDAELVRYYERLGFEIDPFGDDPEMPLMSLPLDRVKETLDRQLHTV